MGPIESPSKTPTRIPRPTFMASSPRTPSIRAVPYNHTDRLAHASWSPGSYSPSSWPFPKSAKSSSMDLSSTAAQRQDERSGSIGITNDNIDTRSGHRASGTSSLSIAGSRGHAAIDRTSAGHARADVSFDSIETQIYAPRRGNSSVSASRPVSKSAKGSLVESTIDVFERPMTPTPYSTLRKASETSQLGNDDGRIPLHHPQSSVMQDDASNDISVAGSANDASLAHSVAAPRDEASPEQPGVHPLFRSSITSSKSRHAQDTGDKTQRSGHSGRGSVDVSAPAGKPHGITTLKPAEDMETRISVGALMRNFSIKSRAPTTAGEDTVPDLESLRRGPRIRHSRLPPSPSMAVNHAWQLPKSTREMWSITDRSRNMSIISAVVLELSILSFVSSVTAMIMSPMEHGDPATGTVVGTVVSGAFAVAFAVLLWFSLLQYRKTSKDLVSGETWIEMHRRSRPLPRRPDSEERQQDNAATQAWKKFAQDHAQLRRYVEYLESRVGILEEGQPTNTDQHNDGSSAGATRASSSAIGGAENGIGYGRVDHNGGSTPKARNFKVGGSLSRRELLPRDDTAAEPEDWRDGENRAAIPQSDTRTSILTELCAAVTEYSPLSEQMPRGSGHFGQVSNNNTPSVRPRGNTLRGYLTVPDRAVIHQRGVQSIDILRGKVEGV